MTPGEVKFALDAKLLSLAKGSEVPVITDLHSVRVENDTVHVGYELLLGDEPFFFAFERPAAVGRDEIDDFVRWLAWQEGGTVH